MYTITAYCIYLVFSLITVLWVGKTLHKNGKDFLFGECPDKALSESTNNIIYSCYCLVNTGFAFYFLNTCNKLQSWTEVVDFITKSESFIFFSLGIMHFLNMIFVPKIIFYLFSKKTNINLKN